MKLTLRSLLASLLFAAAIARPIAAQHITPGPGGFLAFGTVTTTGQLGGYVDFRPLNSSPSNHTVDWSYSGTAPTACTLQAEGSSDAVHWFSLSGSQDCTTANMIHVANKPVVYFRLNILTYTAGDGTTAVTVRYTRGS